MCHVVMLLRLRIEGKGGSRTKAGAPWQTEPGPDRATSSPPTCMRSSLHSSVAMLPMPPHALASRPPALGPPPTLTPSNFPVVSTFLRQTIPPTLPPVHTATANVSCLIHARTTPSTLASATVPLPSHQSPLPPPPPMPTPSPLPLPSPPPQTPLPPRLISLIVPGPTTPLLTSSPSS